MSDETSNAEILKTVDQRWMLGGSVDEWMKICDENVCFGSIAQSTPRGPRYLTEYRSRDALKENFAGLECDGQMIEFAAEHFVAQGDRVVMLGRCAWRYKKTGKGGWTKKAGTRRWAGGKSVEYFEYFDTAQVQAAVA